jgi:NAD(P)-dependent dehydrogenase (short-subunit alcohol dehydrogenase family)
MGVKVDIASVDDTLALSDRVRERFGEVHGLVNNAALMSALPRRSWTEIPLEEWDLVMTVNLRGLFLTCRSIVPLMTSGGSVVNISSTRALDGTPNRLHYTTSKSGCLGFTRALAREVGAQGVRVNSVAPGITLSDNQVATSDPDYLDALAVGRALPRQQRPSDLTGAVVFLLSDASAFISGQTLVVDGGKVMN